MLPQLIIMLTGAALILCGVVAIGFQLYTLHVVNPAMYTVPGDMAPDQRSGVSGLGLKFMFGSRFVGIPLIVIGAFLEIVGYVGAVAWQ